MIDLDCVPPNESINSIIVHNFTIEHLFELKYEKQEIEQRKEILNKSDTLSRDTYIDT